MVGANYATIIIDFLTISMDLNSPDRHCSRNHARFQHNSLALVARHKRNKSASQAHPMFAADDVHIPAKGILAVVNVSLVRLDRLALRGGSSHTDGIEKVVDR